MESPRTEVIFDRFFDYFFALPDRAVLKNPQAGVSSRPMDILRDALTQTAVVLTPNDRLATRLSQAFMAWSAQAGSQVYAMPTFMSLTRWTREQWFLCRGFLPDGHSLAGRTRLLCAQSEWVLWEKLVASTEGLSLLDVGGLARLAQEAYVIERGWQIKPQEIQAHAQGDQRYYVRWREAFLEACHAQAVLPGADVIPVLLALPAGMAAPMSRCCWLGFSELTPIESALFESMASVWAVTPQKMSLQDFLSSAEASADQGVEEGDQQGLGWGGACVCRAEDEDTELLEAMAWLGERFSPAAKLALVVPDLPTRKMSLERAFQTQWAPNWAPQGLLALPDANVTDTPLAEWVSFSGGTALAELPLFAPVRALATFSKGQVALPELVILLTNPYVACEPAERVARQRFMRALQAQQLTHWSLAEVLESWRSGQLAPVLKACPDWMTRFEQSLDMLCADRLSASAVFTPSMLDALLNTWGWPGDQALDSAEYQQLKKWGGVRAQWQEMLRFREQLGEPASAAISISYLQEVLSKQIFQPKSQDTPLQVLGILEALEQPFDALWFMGAEDQVLPPAARPHPLLPQSLQRHYNSLRATPGRELALARETVRAFSKLTWETCFSWSARTGNRDCAPSRLIAHLPVRESSITTVMTTNAITPTERPAAEAQRANVSSSFHEHIISLEQQSQTHALPISTVTTSADHIKGGTGILKTFAECPFKAFVRYRLGIAPPVTPSLGLDAVMRGILVHAVLESIWRELCTQSALLALSVEARHALVQTHCARVLAEFAVPAGLYLAQVLLAVESQRLQRIVLQWLALEEKRAPFRVKSVEQALTINLAGLQFEIRLDRIDETPKGELLVIDYKTGQTDVGQWFGRRVQAPQLPLYCTALDSATSDGTQGAKGVFYGIVKAGKPQFKGTVAEGVAVMQDNKDSRSITENPQWPDLVSAWGETLTHSAADFAAGAAQIDPIEGTRTCERCDYAAVCRIHERVQRFNKARAAAVSATEVSAINTETEATHA